MSKFTKENLEKRIWELENSHIMKDKSDFEQILEQQKIVDEMIKTYNIFSNAPNRAFAHDNVIAATAILVRIVKKATGKDIEELK